MTPLPAIGDSPPPLVCCAAGKEGRPMRKILKALCFGNIVPFDKRMTADSGLRGLVKHAVDWEGQLMEGLNEEEQQLLDMLTDARHEIDHITALEDFILGFRLGVRLMAECVDEDGGDVVDGGGC